jgi:hypothetical protein
LLLRKRFAQRENETRQIGEHSVQALRTYSGNPTALTDISEMDAELSTGAGDRPPFNTIDRRGPYTWRPAKARLSITTSDSVLDRVQVPEMA